MAIFENNYYQILIWRLSLGRIKNIKLCSKKFPGFFSYVTQICLTASAKFESATKVSIYRKAFDIVFAFLFQVLIFEVIVNLLYLGKFQILVR